MQKPDEIRLRHMLDASREAVHFISGRNRQNLNTDRMLVLSLTREIEIIGEAASRVSEQCRSHLPSIPWQDIIGMRNRLIHAYFDVDLDIVWDVVTHDLPELICILDPLIC